MLIETVEVYISISSTNLPRNVLDRKLKINLTALQKKSDKSTTDNDGSSKASSEFNFGTNLVSPLKKALRHSSNEPKVTNDQSPKNTSCQLSPQSETIIDGYTIQWPKFQIRNALFQGSLTKGIK
ncbi:unnamed protein product [Didymodactylos carnosus]|uniref:Uncharacterized protein n=1 Tax=Didymodactylos carnosus TaxID=1234261 RepID=A0A8S2EDP3_9BILA|nr:unnamed protein product [Didymodactylos carnosus]CAF3903191.1 unnamed protein product [Didymodactylos carnosus]